ncbi:MAG: methionyl-tRNA formyltransferase [Phaeodactylibacter sp.]|nr:methionyl-tRNA formyltransferase [Phaeodactylibacter sp.]
MGTPDFAVPALRILVENGHEVVGVVTATDKYGGRGNKQLIESAVKKYAVAQNLPVLQPKNLKAPEFVEALRALRADLQVVVAFRMLPEIVWDMPRIGTFNLHGSLLPKYRGAAPINWAVINGETETGVTTFFIRHEIDTGDVLLQRKLLIGPDETAGDVHDRMMLLGAQTVLDTVDLIKSGNYTLHQQDDSQATKAPKIFFETCEIDFNQSAFAVHNFVRGLSPYPAAWTTLDEQVLKLYRTKVDPSPAKEAPGTFVSDNRKFLKIATADGYLEVLELQLQGRKRMRIQDFLNGYSFADF